MAAEESTDSPAFRLRPRRGAPKSYYTVRLEYSANPAAFIRTERPRTGAKRKTANSTGRHRNINQTGKYDNARGPPGPGPVQVPVVKTKEEREREERRKRLHRELSSSITANTVISAFLQRKQLDELEPECVYEHDYVTLKIITRLNGTKFLGQDTESRMRVQVDLAKEFANENMIVPGKFVSLGKFRTGPKIDGSSTTTTTTTTTIKTKSPDQMETRLLAHPVAATGSGSATPKTSDAATSGRQSTHHQDTRDDTLEECPKRLKVESLVAQQDDAATNALLPFEVIAKTTTTTEISPQTGTRKTKAIVPFVSITDDVDRPEEPYVE